MRIAYLTQSYPPMISGAALVVENLARAMAKHGHQVLVIAASDLPRAYYSQEGNLTVLRLASLHNPLRVGQRFLLYPHGSVTKTLREFDPEIVHVHEPLQLAWLGIRYAKQANIPCTLTVHQLPSFVASYLPSFLRSCTETILWHYARWLLHHFTAIITPTHTTSALVTRMTGVLTNTISSGIDLEMFHPDPSGVERIAICQKRNFPLDRPILLHVGRLDTEKRVDNVIRAAALTINETEAHLLIIGDGTQKSALIRLAKSLGISDRVHFKGYVSVAEGLPGLYRMATLFVTASEIETQGIVLLEAAANGLPLVAVRATCVPEIVQDGVNGYLAAPGDIPGLGSAMSLLVADPQKALSMGKASRALAEKHSFEFTLDAHEKLYHRLIVESGTRLVKKHRQNTWKRIRKITY